MTVRLDPAERGVLRAGEAGLSPLLLAAGGPEVGQGGIVGLEPRAGGVLGGAEMGGIHEGVAGRAEHRTSSLSGRPGDEVRPEGDCRVDTLEPPGEAGGERPRSVDQHGGGDHPGQENAGVTAQAVAAGNDMGARPVE